VFSYLGKAGDTRAALYRPHVDKKLAALSFVTVGELLYGAAKDSWTNAKLEKLKARLRSVVIVPYDYEVCETYGRIKAALPKGRTIADNDLWIAACAMRHSIPLITHNRRHFDDIKGLIVISEQKVDAEIRSQGELDLKVVASGEPQPPSLQSSSAFGEKEPQP
jgi:tRNA(fMet)-specific endonuclease VapC